MTRSTPPRRRPTPDDVEMNPAICGAPATDASVWYELTPASRRRRHRRCLGVDIQRRRHRGDGRAPAASRSSPAGRKRRDLRCPRHRDVSASWPSTTRLDEDGMSGGTLKISVDAAPPAPEVAVTVDPVGHFTKSGSAIVSGTVTCTGTNVDFAFIDVQLQQRVGRAVINGFGSIDISVRRGHPRMERRGLRRQRHSSRAATRRPSSSPSPATRSSAVKPSRRRPSSCGSDRASASGLIVTAWTGWRLRSRHPVT